MLVLDSRVSATGAIAGAIVGNIGSVLFAITSITTCPTCLYHLLLASYCLLLATYYLLPTAYKVIAWIVVAATENDGTVCGGENCEVDTLGTLKPH
eukprot:scaffold2993_cov64-Phaeocystis_antarctica.AAC.4